MRMEKKKIDADNVMPLLLMLIGGGSFIQKKNNQLWKKIHKNSRRG